MIVSHHQALTRNVLRILKRMKEDPAVEGLHDLSGKDWPYKPALRVPKNIEGQKPTPLLASPPQNLLQRGFPLFHTPSPMLKFYFYPLSEGSIPPPSF